MDIDQRIRNESLKYLDDLNLEKAGSSNSQPESHFMGLSQIKYGEFLISLDKITITADVYPENAEKIFILCEPHQPRIFKRFSNAFSLVLDIYDSALFIQYDKLNESLNARTFRIEFNPNLITDEARVWVQDRILSKLEEGSKKISRLDIAFDSKEDLSDYRFVARGTKTAIYNGVKGDVETLYHGSPSSNRQVRLYNKKRQLEDIHKEFIADEHLWRFEIQLRHTSVENWRDMFKNISMVKLDFNGATFIERCVMESLLKDSNGYSHLSKNVRTKYRRLIEECSTSNLTAQMQHILNKVETELSEMINYWVEGY